MITFTPGTSSTNQKWIKALSLDFGNNNYADFSILLAISSSYSRMQNIIVSVTGRQGVQTNASPYYMNVEILDGSAYANAPTLIKNTSFLLLNNGFGTPFELWIKYENTYGKLTVEEINLSTGNLIEKLYYPDFIPQSDEPTAIFSVRSDNYHFSDIAGDVIKVKSEFTGKLLEYRKQTTNLKGQTITQEDGLFIIKKQNQFFVYHPDSGTLNIKDFGACRGSSYDDTEIYSLAFNHYNKVLIPANSNSYVRNLIVPQNCQLWGCGKSSELRMYRGGTYTDEDNSSTYILCSTGSSSYIFNLFINGDNKVGNGVLVSTDSNGLKRQFQNVDIGNFCSYRAVYDGGSYGILKNKSIADLSLGVGGNGFIIENVSGSYWELNMEFISISKCEGYGAIFNKFTDSNINGLTIGMIGKRAFTMIDVRNCRFSNWKIYKACMANLSESYETSLTKVISIYDGDNQWAANFCGENITAVNIEFQENATNALLIGANTDYEYSKMGLASSTIRGLIVDGNGQINGTQDLNLMRTGVLLKEYYNVRIEGVANDFRSKIKASRQKFAFRFIKPTALTQYILNKGAFVEIVNTSGGADFQPVQNLGTTTNNIGTVFQLSWGYEYANFAAAGGIFGNADNLKLSTKLLEIDFKISNQYDELIGGNGYDLTHNDLTNKITVNNVEV